jgi:hypothetical protein
MVIRPEYPGMREVVWKFQQFSYPNAFVDVWFDKFTR